MERKRQATAAHMKPKLYLPSEADNELFRKLLRPMTYAALYASQQLVFHSMGVKELVEKGARRDSRH